MQIEKITSGSVTNVTATGELGGLFLPGAVGYRPYLIGGSSSGFSRKTYDSYDDPYSSSTVHTNRVTVTPPSFAVPCRAATTANITLSGLRTVDGVALLSGDRVLIKNQSSAAQNGIYVVSTSTWFRETPAPNRLLINVTEGNTNASQYFVLRNTAGIILGTTAIDYDLVTDPFFLENNTVYWLRFKDFPLGAQYYATDNNTNPINPKLATTSNITLSGLPIIDGVQTVVFDIVLVKNQTVLSENGLYTVRAGAWDFMGSPFDISQPWLIYVSSGTVNGGRTFRQTRVVTSEWNGLYFAEIISRGFTPVSMILYPTLADATAETNALKPTYFAPFDIEWIIKPYTPIACVEMAAADVADIYCCPEPVPLLQTFPDHVELSLAALYPDDAETIVLKLFDPSSTYVSTYDGETYSGLGYFVYYEYDDPIMCSGVSRTNLRRSFQFRMADGSGTYQAQILEYVLGSGADTCASSWAYYSDYFYRVWRSNENYSYETPVSLPSYSEFEFYQTSPRQWTSYNTALSPPTWTSTYPVGGAPYLLSFDIQYAQTIPPTISCYLIDAVFQRTTVDIPSGDDIAIGTISVTLTYDAASSTYYGPVANYFNIPGRLSMPAGLQPTVASGKKFLEVTDYNWKVNSSNQIYYEHYLSSGAPNNTINLFYSIYSDARKPTPATSEFYKTNAYYVYTNTNGSLLRSDPTTQTATP
jgi:hypothetical protein